MVNLSYVHIFPIRRPLSQSGCPRHFSCESTIASAAADGPIASLHMDGNGLCPGRQLYVLRRCRGVSPIVYAGLVETGLEERSAFLGVFTELRSLGVSPSNCILVRRGVRWCWAFHATSGDGECEPVASWLTRKCESIDARREGRVSSRRLRRSALSAARFSRLRRS